MTTFHLVQTDVRDGKPWVTDAVRYAIEAPDLREGPEGFREQSAVALATQAIIEWWCENEYANMDDDAKNEWGYPALFPIYYNDNGYWSMGKDGKPGTLYAALREAATALETT